MTNAKIKCYHSYNNMNSPIAMTVSALCVASLVLGASAETVFVQDREVFVHDANYDKGKMPPYTLEDPLVFADGRRVSSAADWTERRREILDIFAKEMYGAEPPAPEALVTELVDEKDVIDGHALRRQYKMWFRADKSGPCITWAMWIPKAAKKPVPVISFLNYRGNHELVPDEDIPVQQGWTRAGEKYGVTNHTSRRTRASSSCGGSETNPAPTTRPRSARGHGRFRADSTSRSAFRSWTRNAPL